jgi:hypothetical protein
MERRNQECNNVSNLKAEWFHAGGSSWPACYMASCTLVDEYNPASLLSRVVPCSSSSSSSSSYCPSCFGFTIPRASAVSFISDHSGRGISTPSAKRPYVIPPSLLMGRRICESNGRQHQAIYTQQKELPSKNSPPDQSNSCPHSPHPPSPKTSRPPQ